MITRKQYRNAKETVHYFDKNLEKSDYHTQDGLIIGTWHGNGAKALNLSKEVKREDFEQLINNVNPNTGKSLTSRNVKNRTVGEDWCMSCPKSVSIQHAITGDKEIPFAIEKAVQKTLAEIEKDTETRVRVGGKYENRKTENLIVASFLHDDSRPVNREIKGKKVAVPDPQLHVHNVIINATHDEKEDKWKAVQFRNMVASLPYYREVFNGHLAQNLQAVGYTLKRTPQNFEIEGYDRKTIEKFSNRTKEIEDLAKEKGIIDPSAKAKLGAKSRNNKRKGLDQKELKEFRLAQLDEQELQVIQNAKKEIPKTPDKNLSQESAKEAVAFAVEHGLARKSVVGHRELMRHALNKGKVTTTQNEIEQEIKNHKHLISKETPDGMIYTNTIAHVEEKKLIAETRIGKGTYQPINPNYKTQNELLTKEQNTAVHHVLNSRDFITVINGRAGTGKTWSVKEIAKGVEGAGLKFNGYAPSSEASRRVQREEGFQKATTIAELLVNERRHEEIKGGVIWLDEAGMIGNKTLNDVINLAKKQNARILMTGDTRQHNSVERGDAMRIIQEFGHTQSATISKNQRQKNDSYRNAVNDLSKGRMEDGFKTLDKMGAIQEANDFDGLTENVANDYLKSVKAKDKAIVIAPTHKQGRAVTQSIRAKLKTENLLHKEETAFTTLKNKGWDDAQKKDSINYQNGNVIEFIQNVKGGFTRGSKYEVSKVDGEGKVLIKKAHRQNETEKDFILPMEAREHFSVYEKQTCPIAIGEKIRMTKSGSTKEKHRLENGDAMTVKGFTDDGHIKAFTGRKTITIDKNFGHLTHGYTMTSPKSQGKTVNKVIIMQGSMSGKATNMEQFYVSASRGKFSVSVHTDDKAQLLHNIKRSSKRMTAMEVASEKKNDFNLVGEFDKSKTHEPKSASKLNTDWQHKGTTIPEEQEDYFDSPPPPRPLPNIESPSL